MADRRSNIQRKAKRPTAVDIFGFEVGESGPHQRVTSNGALLTPTFRHTANDLGLTASRLELGPQKSSIVIEKTELPFRLNEGVAGENLATLDELAEQSQVVERQGEKVVIDGVNYALDVATGLVIGDEIVAFGRAELEYHGRGESGPTGLSRGFPGRQILAENNQEHFIIGQQGGKEVIVAIDTGDSPEQQAWLVRQTRERLVQTQRFKLSQITANRRIPPKEIASITEQIAYLQKERPIVFVKPKKLPEALESTMQTIETRIVNGIEEREQIKGYLDIEAERKIATVMQLVNINPAEQGIVPMHIIDGLGTERTVRRLSAPSKSLTPHFNQIVTAWHRYLHRPEIVQSADKAVTLPDIAVGSFIRDRYAVPAASIGFIQR